MRGIDILSIMRKQGIMWMVKWNCNSWNRDKDGLHMHTFFMWRYACWTE